MICLMNSTLFHLCGTHSRHTHFLLARCDYSGIAILITGSFMPAVYYGFYCSPVWKVVYASLMCSVAAVVVVFCNLEWFYQQKYRLVRALMFISMGCSGIIPGVHMLLEMGHGAVLIPFMWHMAAMGVAYLAGATLYATRIPERYVDCWRDTWVDQWIDSHLESSILLAIAISFSICSLWLQLSSISLDVFVFIRCWPCIHVPDYRKYYCGEEEAKLTLSHHIIEIKQFWTSVLYCTILLWTNNNIKNILT